MTAGRLTAAALGALLSLLFLFALLIITVACGPRPTPEPDTSPPAAQSTAEGPAAAPSPTPAAARNTAIEVVAEPVAKELKSPWAVAFAPDGRIFITEREGAVRVIVDGQVQSIPYASMEPAQEGEGGLLGIAIHPDFATNGYVYVYHTYRNAQGALRNKIVRWEDAGATARGPVTILDEIPGARIHNGGRIKFGPDGMLYATTGDAAEGPLAQDLSSLAGKILRLNPDGTVPADNPFPGSPVYSYGHRNPQGLAWRPGTGQLYATEHGPVGQDEVNLIIPGGNYGWPEVSGDAARPEFIAPVLQSGLETWAPSGAAFVTGPRMPEWEGRLLFGALRGQRLVWVDMRPPEYTAVQGQDSLFARKHGRIRDVVLAPDGYVYFITSNLDGRGRPRQDDDVLLRMSPVAGVLSHRPGQVDSPNGPSDNEP